MDKLNKALNQKVTDINNKVLPCANVNLKSDDAGNCLPEIQDSKFRKIKCSMAMNISAVANNQHDFNECRSLVIDNSKPHKTPFTGVNCKQLKLQFINSNTEELMEVGDDFVAYVTEVNGRLSTIEYRVKTTVKRDFGDLTVVKIIVFSRFSTRFHSSPTTSTTTTT